jgi:2,4-dienoyl-CoA reductase-like NADH-dependent reductase (Old Yellow Enzyme family)
LKSFTEDLTVGVQLAHAGRKASTWSPFHRGDRKVEGHVTKEEGGWPEEVIAPSAIPYGPGWLTPKAMSVEDIQSVKKSFVDAARRAFTAGVDFVELHVAHGYLLNSFISPSANIRTDNYGGSFENRIRIVLEIIDDIKKEFPNKSVWVRVSSTDFCEHLDQESWNEEQTIKFAKVLNEQGKVDVLDCSAGGVTHLQKITPKPAYQLPFAAGVSHLKLSNLLVGTVGIMEGDEYLGQVAEKALQDGDAQLIFLARGLLSHPSWPEEASVNLMGTRAAGNPQYHRVHPAKQGTHRGNAPSKAQNNN